MALLLTACATTNPIAMETAEVSAVSFCQYMPFPGVASCVLNRFNMAYPRWQSDANADLVKIFLAWSEAAGQRVAQGMLSDADAHKEAYALQARLDRIATERRARRELNSQMAAQMMLAGFAIMAAAQPQPPQIMVVPQPAVAQPMPSPPAPIALFSGSAPRVTGSPLQPPPLSIPQPIVCTVMGDGQMAQAVCH